MDKIDKLAYKLKKGLNRDRAPGIFVPTGGAPPSDFLGLGSPLCATRPAPPPPPTRSISQGLLPTISIAEGNRRTSAPAPSDRFAPSPSAGQLSPLSIETGNGACAGSGYDWLNEDVNNVECEGNLTLRAQKLGLDLISRKVGDHRKLLDLTKQDCRDLDEILAVTFANVLEYEDPAKLEKLKAEIATLEDEIVDLRKLSKKPLPPDRPMAPRHGNTWTCLRCASETPTSEYRCKECRLPGPSIDPKETVVCPCSHCQRACAERLFVSVSCEGDDWLMVNRLNYPAPSSPSTSSELSH